MSPELLSVVFAFMALVLGLATLVHYHNNGSNGKGA